jgi:methylphosphotriester-DNA--protein-cysteine methyltransferase
MAKQAKPKNLGGRPVKDIDFKLLDVLCAAQCTAEEIATYLGVSEDTLGRRIKEKFDIGFAEYFSKKRAAGFASLRSSQFKLAKTNATMSIWLGKQYLGQKDRPDDDHNEVEAVGFRFEKVKDE